MLLVKNCKLLPVMVVGALINGVRYKTYEYVAVGLISLGVVLFMMKGKGGGGGHGHGHGHGSYSANYGPTKSVGAGAPSIADAIASDKLWNILMAVVGSLAAGVSLSELRGLLLAMTNLTIDGFTNAEQDRINQRHGVSPYYMMAMVNIWSLCFAGLYLLGDLLYRGAGSELASVLAFIQRYPGVRADLVSFAFANALGQVFIYSIIDEFGSLVSVTVTVTRKMITLFLSIIIHKHSIQWWQWLGVLSVFSGVAIKIAGGGKAKGH
jgi:solute carrier family 35 (UDP-galactose transporter), member B1